MKRNHHQPEGGRTWDLKDINTVKLGPFRKKGEKEYTHELLKQNSVLK